MRNLITFLVITYVFAWAFVRFSLYYDQSTIDEHPPQLKGFQDLQDNSGIYHGVTLKSEVTVVSDGPIVFDLLFVDCVMVKDHTDAVMPLFGNYPKLAEKTTITIEADFRQLPTYWPFYGYGLMLKSWTSDTRYSRSSGF
jgi:hypothetical protein